MNSLGHFCQETTPDALCKLLEIWTMKLGCYSTSAFAVLYFRLSWNLFYNVKYCYRCAFCFTNLRLIFLCYFIQL